MVQLQSYDSYRLFLKDALSEWARRGSGRSLRSFAMHAGMSPSFLSRVLSGERNLTLQYGGKLQKLLGLSGEDMLYLFDLIEIENAPDSGARAEIMRSVAERRGTPSQILSIEQFKLVADWYHFAILSLVQTKGFHSDAKWVARRLGIDKAQAHAAIQRLVSLGLLRWRGKSLELTGRNDVQTPHDLASAAVKENHRQHLALAEKALFELDVELREFANRTLNLNLKDVPEAKRRIRRFLDRFNKELDRPLGEDVYQINVQFYRASKVEKGQA